jgi:dTDP-4-amino-4,6-dideoxygalactose transaminase
MEFTDLKAQYNTNKTEIDAAIQRVLNHGKYINGPEVAELEDRVSDICNTFHSVGVSSGTDALLVSLMAMGIGPGDEVITTPMTFISTSEVIALLGAKPVFVDIDEDTMNIDAKLIEANITINTKAIMPVHLYGQMADMSSIVQVADKHSLYIIEDAAQAIYSEQHGRRAGSIGDCGAFSFFPAKNLGSFGDGGMVTTNDDELAAKIRSLKNHGQEVKYSYPHIGINGRLDTIQAAVVLAKANHVFKWIEKRREIADVYTKELQGVVATPIEKEENKHTYNQYVIRLDNRDGLQEHLKGQGIPSIVHYPRPLHLQECFGYLGYKEGDLPVAEQACKEVLSLPISPELTTEDQAKVIRCIKAYMGGVQ